MSSKIQPVFRRIPEHTVASGPGVRRYRHYREGHVARFDLDGGLPDLATFCANLCKLVERGLFLDFQRRAGLNRFLDVDLQVVARTVVHQNSLEK